MAHDVGAMVPAIPEATPPPLEVDQDLTKFFLDLKEKCEKLHSAEWLAIKRQWVRARNYFDGRQYGDVNESCVWVDYPTKPGEISYTVNAYQAHIQTALTEISKGNTNLSFSHIAPNSRYGQLIAQIAEKRYQTHRRRLFKTSKQIQENLSLLLNGVAARYTYFNENGRYDKSPIMGESEVEGDSSKACAECMSPMDGDECPNCGSTEVAEINAPGFKAKAIVGYSQVQGGENCWESIDPLGMIWYLNASCVEETPFIGWKQVILRDVLEAKFPDRKITGGVRSLELNYQASSRSAAPQSWSTQTGDTGNTSSAEFEQWWFDPSMYSGYVLKSSIKLRNGSTLPQGMKLGQAFPKGLYLAINGKSILDVWNEDKDKKWSIAPYVTRIGTMVGAGTSAALQDQDTINDLRNLQMTSIMNDSFRKEFVNSQYIEPENIPNDPTERAVVTNLPQGGKIVGQAIDILPGSPLSTDAYEMSNTLNQQMQMVLGTFSGNQLGAPDLQAVKNTAAGMQMWREMTVGRFYPMLAVRAEMLDQAQAYQLLENDQKYLTPQQWQEVKGDYDEEGLKAFLNCDLCKELVIEVADNSFMPKSLSQMQAGLEGFGMFVANTQTPPDSEMGSYAAEIFGIPEHIFGKEATVSAAYVAIGLFKDQADPIVQELGDIPSFDINDPQVSMLAQLVVEEANSPISFEMDDLSTYADALRDWWKTDDGRNASNVLKAAVHYRMKEIDLAAVQKTQKELTLQMASQQPMIQAQQQAAMAQSQAEAQANGANDEAQRQHEADIADREQANNEQQMQAEAVGRAMDSEQSDVEHQRQMQMMGAQDQMAEREHSRQMAMKDKDIQLAKIKKTEKKSEPKPSGKK